MRLSPSLRQDCKAVESRLIASEVHRLSTTRVDNVSDDIQKRSWFMGIPFASRSVPGWRRPHFPGRGLGQEVVVFACSLLDLYLYLHLVLA